MYYEVYLLSSIFVFFPLSIYSYYMSLLYIMNNILGAKNSQIQCKKKENKNWKSSRLFKDTLIMKVNRMAIWQYNHLICHKLVLYLFNSRILNICCAMYLFEIYFFSSFSNRKQNMYKDKVYNVVVLSSILLYDENEKKNGKKHIICIIKLFILFITLFFLLIRLSTILKTINRIL